MDNSKTTQLDTPRSKVSNAHKPHEYGEKPTAEESAALQYTVSIQAKESARRLKNLKKSPLDTTKSSTRAKKKRQKNPGGKCFIQGGKKRKKSRRRRKTRRRTKHRIKKRPKRKSRRR